MAAAGVNPERSALAAGNLREAMRRLAQAVDVKDVPVATVEDRRLPGPGGPLLVRVYTPEGAGRSAAGLLYFHGGMGVFCDVQTHDGLCRLLANASGCRVASVDYRMAPEHPFPAAVEDCYWAARWIAEHAAELGLDPARLAIGGDSHGGTLAAVVCQLAKDAGGPALALQALFCPVLDLAAETPSRREFASGHFLDKSTLDWAVAQYCVGGEDLADPRISPLRAAELAGLPPAHIHTAEFDPMRDEGKAYADALTAAGVDVRHVCHAGMIHHFYGMAGAIPYARAAIEDAGAAIKDALA